MKHSFKKVFLIVLDGFGLAPATDQNPVAIAKMPFLNSLVAKFPSFNIVASGLVVGLPWGKPGNSEVGHSAIGTGRVIIQDWARINGDIKSGAFYTNEALLSAVNHAKKNKVPLHIVGCTSPGGIHAHEDHAIALLELAAREGVEHTFLHMITDGEDAGPTESLATLQRLHPALTKAHARVATVIGRIYGMDRVLNWDLTQQAYEAMVAGKGKEMFEASFYLSDMHQKNVFDDTVPPGVVKNTPRIKPGDAVVFFNYRNDRMKQIVSLFKEHFVVTMTRYANDLPVNAVAYEAPDIHHTLGKEISRRDLKQFRVAEKEKESHINNFFNGGRVDPYEGTEQIIVSSKQLKGDEYLEHPEMSAKKITEELVGRIEDDFTLYLVNFANADMMAHTGNMKATVSGLKVIDDCLKTIVNAILQQEDSAIMITCDHGNCEELIDPATGGPDTQHSTNNVMAIVSGGGLKGEGDKSLDMLANQEPSGSLIDIAPTILHLLEFEKPVEMTGSSLLT
ncbi:MAG: 2,3-bisphosphoglycerate-independent phosphoglycerate mutase [Patescibacteria group bacterium]